MNPTDRSTEARLRRTLHDRADAVEPEQDDFATVERLGTARRRAERRRVNVLGVAAALVAVVGLAGILAIGTGGDDDGRTAVAAGGPTATTTTTTTAATAPERITSDPDPDAPVIWPLPGMSVSYADPADAALAFAQAYLGLTGPFCTPTTTPDTGGGTTVELINEGVCGGGIAAHDAFGPRLTIRVVRNGARGWAVTGATSDAFTATVDPNGTGRDVAITALTALSKPLTVEVRPVGSLDRTATRTAAPPPAPGAGVTATLDDPIGRPAVLVVTDGTNATAMVIADL